MPASFSLSSTRRAHTRPLSVRNFMLVALAIVLAAGVTMLVITRASASEVAGAFAPSAMADGAIGIAALGSLLVSSVVAVLLVMRRPPVEERSSRVHSGRGTPAV